MKMKISIRNFILIGSLILLGSCEKWLDIQPKGKILLTSADDYGMLLDNTATFSYDISDITYIDDEMWRNASNIASVWNSWNLVAANMLYLSNADYDRSLNAAGNSGTTGSSLYQVSYGKISKIANTILFEKDNMTGTEAAKKEVIAQAKLLRAFNYFFLINMYAKPYDKATAAKDGGVPLKLDPYIETIPEPAKSSVADVYAQIVKDVTEAIPDLYDQAASPYRFNKAAAYAFLAKVYLFEKEFDKCLDAATQSNTLSHQLWDLAGWVDPVTHKPAYGLYANGSENLYFAKTSSNYTYIGQELIDLFNAGLTAYGQADIVTDAREDLYQRPSSTVYDYKYILGWVPNTKQYSPNVAGFATPEVMLMMAECYARKGQNEKVKEVLEPYFESRYRNYNPADLVLPSDIPGTVKMVIDERRKELTRGMSRFWDLRRLNTEPEYQKVPTRLFPADPASTLTIPRQTYTLPVNSPLYILPFPSKVLENDTRLTSNTW